MKKTLLSTAAITALGVFAGSAQAGVSATVRATASARVTSPILLEIEEHLSFGTFSIYGSGLVGTSGTLYDGNSQTTPAAPGSVTTAAKFIVTGPEALSYNVAPIAPFNITNGDYSISVATVVPEGNLAVSDGGFSVGGVLSIKGTEGPGLYTATFPVTITYQ